MVEVLRVKYEYRQTYIAHVFYMYITHLFWVFVIVDWCYLRVSEHV